MLFNSIRYLFLFLPIVFIIYFLINKYRYYNCAKTFLLAASIFFYGSYKWEYVYILVCSTLFNYAVSMLFRTNINDRLKKASIVFAVAGNVGLLLFFKYFNLIHDVFLYYDWHYLDTLKIVIPLGISFFTLQQLSYIIDCYKGEIKKYNLLDYSLFVAFFPQIIAGPIVRHQEMIPQFNNLKNKVINQENIYIGIFLITVGLIKKAVFADGFISFLNYTGDNGLYYSSIVAWLNTFIKAIQGYFDFSGYCDMALGSAFLFNISLPWNFNSPFQSKSIIEYWKRWNMTLVRFLRIYVYRPMGADKRGVLRNNFNVLFVFSLIGLWIGFSHLSILYGFINGVLVLINRLWNKLNINLNKIISVAITFISVIIPVQFLGAKNLNHVYAILKSMFLPNWDTDGISIFNWNIVFTFQPPYSSSLNILLLISSIIIIFFFKNSMQLAKIYAKANNTFYTILLVIAFIFAVLSITKSQEFLYFVF